MFFHCSYISKSSFRFYKVFSILGAFVLFFTLLFSTPMFSYATEERELEIEARRQIPIESNANINWPQGPIVNAQSAILIEANTGAILYEKNANEALYPASTTKILSCVLAMENSSMDEIVTFSHDAVFSVPWDGSKIAIDEGEELTMEECLSAILIRSANEVTNAVAEHVGGSMPAFAEMMNEKAKELGCTNSHFVNANGLHNENHYTTAHDLAMIGRAFFSYDFLNSLSTTPILHLYPTEKQPDEIYEHNKNRLLKGAEFEYEYLVGSKTGYTNEAQATLVTCAQKDGLKLICVVLKEHAPQQYEDTIALFNYGFSNFDAINISQTDQKYNVENNDLYYSTHDVFGNSTPILSINTQDYIVLPKTVNFSDLTSQINYQNPNDHSVAQIEYTYQNVFLGSAQVHLTNKEENTYHFDEIDTKEDLPIESNIENPKKNVIFINVFKILLWILGLSGALILIILLRAFFSNYQLNGRDSRRKWRKRKRKRRQTLYQNRANRIRRAKRPSRFRDYDF